MRVGREKERGNERNEGDGREKRRGREKGENVKGIKEWVERNERGSERN